MAPSPEGGEEELWRVFPWDPAAPAGAPFSPGYTPQGQGSGRFDLRTGQVLYLAELPQHAIAEKLARFRGRRLQDYHLREFGHPLAIVPVRIAPRVRGGIADLCDPEVLARHRIRPDDVSARDAAKSQAVAQRLYDAGVAGLRWWSSFFGEWHGVVLFLDRLAEGELLFGDPRELVLADPALRGAAEDLGIEVVPVRLVD